MKVRLGPLIVLGMVAPVAFGALGLRDLAGEEIVFYFGLGPLGILRQAVDPESAGSFHAHQPLSYLVRWAVTTVLPVTAATLRIHAAGFACAAAVATWWLAERTGNRLGAVVAGVVVGWSPVLAFHAHESSGYAATPLFGALVLAGLVDLWGDESHRRRGGALLALGLIGGMANDFFFAFAVLASLFVTPWGRSQARRAWGAFAAVAVAVSAVFTASLFRLDEAHRLAPHLDPVVGAPSLGGSITQAGVGLVEGFFHGYTRAPSARESAGLAAAVLGCVAVAAVVAILWRPRSELRPAAVAGTWALLLVAIAGGASAAFQGATGTQFTTDPRALLAALPALAVLSVVPGPGRWAALLSAALGTGILAVQVLPMAHTVLDPPRGQRDAALRLQSEVRAGDHVYGTAVHPLVLGALPHGVTVSTSFDGCLPAGAVPPDRVWILGDAPPTHLPLCSGSIDLVAAGFHPTLLDQHPLPEHEAWPPSYLPEVHLARWERGAPTKGPEGPFVRWIELRGGVPAATLRVRLDLPDGVIRYREVPTSSDPIRLALRVPDGTRASMILVGGDGADLAAWRPRAVTGPRADQTWVLRTPPGTGWAPSADLLLRMTLGLWTLAILGYAGEARRWSQGTKLDAA